ERQDAGPRPDIDDPFSREIEAADESGEEFAGEKQPRMKHGRAHQQMKSGGLRHARAAALEHEIVAKEVNDLADRAASHALRRALTAEPTAVFDCVCHVSVPLRAC